SRSTAFMEMLVFSLFNYGSDRREAFLLLQLFTEALRYEIRQKVEQPQDVITGNPTIIKMLVNFYRHAQGQNALRESLGPALQDVLLDQTLSIRTDPLEVYKTWINQTETQTGHKRDALKTKFPAASESELYKVILYSQTIVSNLVYYRYMNPAIVAPDGFDVVDRSAGSTLQPEQRHVLGSIARMLQHAAANKHFHGDGYHVQALNQYITQTHSKFRRFLYSVCDVPEPEERFSVDKYSELLIVNRPVIYISVSELLNTHK
ncbi:hypothetical protein GOODEAATRI_029161, partial [Goodea atripinnis]